MNPRSIDPRSIARLVLAASAVYLAAASACVTQYPARPAARVTTAQGPTVHQVCQIASEVMRVEPSRVTAATSLGELGADEVDFVDLVFELEAHFAISICDQTAGRIVGTDDWQIGLKSVTMAELAAVVDEQRR